jgi:hypothetical protein
LFSLTQQWIDAWVIFCSLLGLVILAPEGNMATIDAYFFGASASTESGLNTYVSPKSVWDEFQAWLNMTFSSVDVKDLRTYQQVFIYIIPTITNLMVVNIMVVVARIFWFKKKLRAVGKSSSLNTQWRDGRLIESPVQLSLILDQCQRAWFSH